jgi:nucleoid-associated protein YgaU
MVSNDELILTNDDLYSNGYYVQFDDGTKLLKRDKIVFPNSQTNNYRPIQGGETLSSISFDEYSNSKLWWNIADNNNIFNPFDIQPGTGLNIPNISIT